MTSRWEAPELHHKAKFDNEAGALRTDMRVGTYLQIVGIGTGGALSKVGVQQIRRRSVRADVDGSRRLPRVRPHAGVSVGSWFVLACCVGCTLPPFCLG